jgi:hypothetical protein
VNVAPLGSIDALKEAMPNPSGSATLIAKVRFVPAVPGCSAGAATTGARGEPAGLTVIRKISRSETPPAVAVTAAVYSPT